MKAKLLAATAALVVTGATIAALSYARQAGGSQPGDAPKSTYSVDQARAFTGFPLYWAGPQTADLPLVAVLRNKADDPASANYVAFIYGDCRATGDTGCAPPLEIQVWPACRRNPARFKEAVAMGLGSREAATVRGVPAYYYDGGQQLEVQTGISTVVIFAASRAVAAQTAGALEGVNNAVAAGQPLPQPPAAALTGGLTC